VSMPKSRGRKPHKQRQLPQPKTIPLSRTRPFLRWLQAKRLHQIEFGVSLVVGLVAVGGWAYDALREPEIHTSRAQVSDPFALRFSLHNPSFFFPMQRMTFICRLANVRMENNSRFTGNLGLEETFETSVQPRKTIQYSCPFNRMFANRGVVTASVFVTAKFMTLGFSRESNSEPFNWDNVSKEWTEGAIIN
jgi:hypothetical protein